MGDVDYRLKDGNMQPKSKLKNKKTNLSVVNCSGVGDSLRDIIYDASMAHCKIVSAEATILFLRNAADSIEKNYKE